MCASNHRAIGLEMWKPLQSPPNCLAGFLSNKHTRPSSVNRETDSKANRETSRERKRHADVATFKILFNSFASFSARLHGCFV